MFGLAAIGLLWIVIFAFGIRLDLQTQLQNVHDLRIIARESSDRIESDLTASNSIDIRNDISGAITNSFQARLSPAEQQKLTAVLRHSANKASISQLCATIMASTPISQVAQRPAARSGARNGDI